MLILSICVHCECGFWMVAVERICVSSRLPFHLFHTAKLFLKPTFLQILSAGMVLALRTLFCMVRALELSQLWIWHLGTSVQL